MIAALFVETNGIYYGLPDVDPWDEARDARTYAGPWPVVAHPPCARWCRLAALVEHKLGIPVGADGGCFSAALNAVRTWGGVLEHPAESKAWYAYNLPRPRRGEGWVGGLCGGWSAYVDQGHYGHLAQKATWLYAHGVLHLPELRWAQFADAQYVVTTSRRINDSMPQMPHRMRSRTPVDFRDLLLGIARSAQREECKQ
jgi:hypothetical protein